MLLSDRVEENGEELCKATDEKPGTKLPSLISGRPFGGRQGSWGIPRSKKLKRKDVAPTTHQQWPREGDPICGIDIDTVAATVERQL
jgi:hypothetical protein